MKLDGGGIDGARELSDKERSQIRQLIYETNRQSEKPKSFIKDNLTAIIATLVAVAAIARFIATGELPQ